MLSCPCSRIPTGIRIYQSRLLYQSGPFPQHLVRDLYCSPLFPLYGEPGPWALNNLPVSSLAGHFPNVHILSAEENTVASWKGWQRYQRGEEYQILQVKQQLILDDFDRPRFQSSVLWRMYSRRPSKRTTHKVLIIRLNPMLPI